MLENPYECYMAGIRIRPNKMAEAFEEEHKMLLNDEEIINYTVPPRSSITEYHTLLKAQIKKVVEWGNEICPHTGHNEGVENIPALLYKKFCGPCWQSLLEEVKE